MNISEVEFRRFIEARVPANFNGKEREALIERGMASYRYQRDVLEANPRKITVDQLLVFLEENIALMRDLAGDKGVELYLDSMLDNMHEKGSKKFIEIMRAIKEAAEKFKDLGRTNK